MQVTGAGLETLVLGGKAAIAVLLLAAGGAKLADLAGFTASVRLFVPAPDAAAWAHRVPRALAAGIVAVELAVGAASLAVPQARWLNSIVLAVCVGFVAVSGVGYDRHRGRPCRCFGALSHRGFSAAGLLRAMALLLVAAVLVEARVPAAAIDLRLGGRLGLLAGGALIAAIAYTAAMAAATGSAGKDPAGPTVGRDDTGPRWA